MAETTDLRWFDAYGLCRMCSRVEHGVLRGSSNQSYGPHCKKCAMKRLRDSENERQKMESVS